MVQIPTFTSKARPQKLAGVVSGVPDPTAAAMLPYQTASKIGDQVLGMGTKMYQQQKEIKGKLYELKKQNELQEIRINTDYADKVYKITEDYKTDMDIALGNIKRSNMVKSFMNEMKPIEHEQAIKASENPNTDVAWNNYSENLEIIARSKISKFNDKVAEGVAQMDWESYFSSASLSVMSTLRKTDIDKAKIIFDKELEDLQFDFHHGNAHVRLKAINKMWGDNGIIYEAYNNKLLESGMTPDMYIANHKKEVYEVEGERMAKESPDRFLFLMKGQYFKDKLTTAKIEDFESIAKSAISARNNAAIASLKSTKTEYLNNGKFFLDVGDVNYFGSEKDYTTLKNQGNALYEQLVAAGLSDQANEVNRFLMEMEGQKLIHLEVKKYRMQPLDEVDLRLAELKTINNLTSNTKFFDKRNVDLEKALQAISDKQTLAIKNGTMLEYIASVGIIDGNPIVIPEIDWMESDAGNFAKQVQDYNFFVNQVAEIWDLPEPQFFQEKDLALIKNTFDTGSKDEILTLSANIAQVAGSQSNSAFGKLTKEYPLFTQVGLLTYMNGGKPSPAVDSIVNAHVLLRNEDNQKIIATLDIDSRENVELRTVLESSIGNALDNLPNTSNQIKEAAKYIFYDFVLKDAEMRSHLVAGKEIFKGNISKKFKKAYSKSIQMAAGMTEYGAGGIEKFNNVNILVSPIHLNGTLEKYSLDGNKIGKHDAPSIEDLVTTYMDEALFNKATQKMVWNYSPVHKTYIQQWEQDKIWLDGEQKFATVGDVFKIQEVEVNMAGIIIDRNLDTYESIYLETAPTLGSYFISFGSPQDFGTEHYYNKKEEKVVLNISRIHQALMEKWKAEHP